MLPTRVPSPTLSLHVAFQSYSFRLVVYVSLPHLQITNLIEQKKRKGKKDGAVHMHSDAAILH